MAESREDAGKRLFQGSSAAPSDHTSPPCLFWRSAAPLYAHSSFILYLATQAGIYMIVALGLNFLTGYAGQISVGHGALVAIGGTPWRSPKRAVGSRSGPARDRDGGGAELEP